MKCLIVIPLALAVAALACPAVGAQDHAPPVLAEHPSPAPASLFEELVIPVEAIEFDF